MRCLIISGGSLDEEFARSCVNSGKYDYYVAADAGLEFYYTAGVRPDLVIGDFDSVQSNVLSEAEAQSGIADIVAETGTQSDTTDIAVEAQSDLRNVTIEKTCTDPMHRSAGTEWIRLDPVKNDTDTEAAIREAINRGAEEMTILGATGTRLDHVLANMALLGIGLEQGVSMQLLDPHNRIRMINRPLTIYRNEQYGRYVSLIPFSDSVTGVTLEGMKYPLKNYTMGGFNSLGISNEILAEKAVISFQSGVLLVIESRDQGIGNRE